MHFSIRRYNSTTVHIEQDEDQPFSCKMVLVMIKRICWSILREVATYIRKNWSKEWSIEHAEEANLSKATKKRIYNLPEHSEHIFKKPIAIVMPSMNIWQATEEEVEKKLNGNSREVRWVALKKDGAQRVKNWVIIASQQ